MNALNTIVTDLTNSYTLMIRDGALARVRKMPFFASFKTFRRSPMHVWQADELPAASIFLLPESMESDGDDNAGEPRFIHTAQFGISILILNNDDDQQENQLDCAFWAIMNGLLTDPTFLIRTYPPAAPRPQHGDPVPVHIEGIPRITRQHIYGTIGKSETPIAELRMQITVNYRTDWPPVEKDDLKVIHVTTAYPIGGDTASTLQVQTQYDIPQN